MIEHARAHKAKSSPTQRVAIPVDLKIQILRSFKDGANIHALAEQFKKDRKTIRDIIKAEEKITEAVQDGCGPARKRLRTSPHLDMERNLVKWMREILSSNVPITGDDLKVYYYS